MLLLHIRLKITDQIWQTSPNESVLHYEIVFVACLQQIGKLVQVVYITVSIFYQITQTFVISSLIDDIETNLPIEKIYPGCICMIFGRNCLQRFVLMLHLCVCLDLLHFVSLLTIYAVKRNVVTYCHTYSNG